MPCNSLIFAPYAECLALLLFLPLADNLDD